MKIEILYNLYTDGDYSLNNPEYFGCTDRNVKTEYDDFLVNRMEIIIKW